MSVERMWGVRNARGVVTACRSRTVAEAHLRANEGAQRGVSYSLGGPWMLVFADVDWTEAVPQLEVPA